MQWLTCALVAPWIFAAAESETESLALAYTSFSGDLQTLKLDGGPSELEMGDVNGDGHPDIVHVGDHGSPFVNTQEHGVTLWLGDGAGGWTLVQEGNFGYGGVAIGDANGDGFMDVGFGVHHNWSSTDVGDQLLEVLTGNGTGSGWEAWDDGLATNGETWGMFGTDFADFDGDGDLDLGSNSFGASSGVRLYRNNGDGTWTQTFSVPVSNSNHDFGFADFNGDGYPDAMAAHQTGTIYLGDGTGSFTSAHGNLPGGAWSAIGAGDVDGDGADELSFAINGNPQVWSWGPGNDWVSLTGNLPSGTFDDTDLADMDMDGRAELVGFGNGNLRIYSLTGPGAWTELTAFTTPGNGSKDGEALRAGVDVDHNGFPDFTLFQEQFVGGIFSTRNHHYVYLENTPAETLTIRAYAPSANRVWHGGQVRFADWTCAVPGADIGQVAVELSSTGPGGPWTPLGSGLPNNGRFQFVVPKGISSSTCHLRYTVTTGPGSAQAVGPAFRIESAGGPVSYCTAGTSASGCQASLSGVGTPSASASAGFVLNCTGVEGNKQGLFFFGTGGPQANPWGNGTSYQCVTPPVRRVPLQPALGANGQCDGSFAYDLNTHWNVFKPNSNPGNGAMIQAQTWYRDPGNTSNRTTSLSDAIELTVGP
jgi:hypothetical protein